MAIACGRSTGLADSHKAFTYKAFRVIEATIASSGTGCVHTLSTPRKRELYSARDRALASQGQTPPKGCSENETWVSSTHRPPRPAARISACSAHLSSRFGGTGPECMIQLVFQSRISLEVPCLNDGNGCPSALRLHETATPLKPGGIMGEWNPCGPHEPAELLLCEAPEPVGTPTPRSTQKRPKASRVAPPWTTPIVWPGSSQCDAMAGHREPPAGRERLTGADDPLLGCLLLLNRVWQRPIPTGVLKGLPHRLTLPQLGDAAAHAGLSTRLAEMELDTIPDRVLPVILLLHKRRPCVLLERREHGRLLVALPGWGGGEQEVSRDELLAQYSRYAILVQPLSQAEGRAETRAETQADMEPAQPGRSTGTATRPSWRHHWDRLTASAHKVFRSRRRRRADEAAVIRS